MFGMQGYVHRGVERLFSRQRGPIWPLIENMYGERLVEVEQTLPVRPIPEALVSGLQVESTSSVVEVCAPTARLRASWRRVSVNLYPADKFKFNMKLRRA